MTMKHSNAENPPNEMKVRQMIWIDAYKDSK